MSTTADVVNADQFGRVTRALCRMPPGLLDEQGQPGPEFVGELTRTILEIDREDAALIDRRATNSVEWGELAAKPAKGSRRTLALLKIGGKLLHHQVDDLLVLPLLQAWNQRHCLPALQPFEVELLWQSLCSKHHGGRR